MKCYIMDDQYWKKLYEGLSTKYKTWDFPIKDNITNPLKYIDDIKNNDLILLDNFFPWETREEPLWAEFLNLLLTKNINCKINEQKIRLFLFIQELEFVFFQRTFEVLKSDFFGISAF